MNDDHDKHMQMALKQAQAAADQGEVPTGCVIVRTTAFDDRPAGAIIGKSHNQTELLKDPTAHAEMIAITQAAAAIGDWRLTDTALYVTKEPCCMCAGAIVLARIPLVVYGATDLKRGGANSLFNILNAPELNHQCNIISGVMQDACASILREFFQQRRKSRSHQTPS